MCKEVLKTEFRSIGFFGTWCSVLNGISKAVEKYMAGVVLPFLYRETHI
jgi:hypothetical protein